MNALHWDGLNLRLQPAYPAPKPGSGMALVRVRLAGICSTDLQILKGYMGFRGVPGHEFVGEVREGPAELAGKRVVGEINFACGRCEFCARELGRHCLERKVMGILGADGSFAEYLSVPEENLHAVPDSVSDEEAVFTEPLAAAFEILDQTPPKTGESVVVLGDGKLGFLCAQVLAAAGGRILVVGKHAAKLERLQKLGIQTAHLSDWKPRPAGMVVDATGSTAGLKLAMSIVMPRGVIVLKSTVAEDHGLSLAPLVINEVTVVGSRCGRFAPALGALSAKSVSVTPLIDKVYPLTDGVQAAIHAARPGVSKILLRCA